MEKKEDWYNRFQTFAMRRMASSSELEEDSFIYWRVRILFALLFGASVLALITIIPVTILVIKEQVWSLGLFDATAWIIVLTLMLSRNIRFETRSTILLVLAYLLGLIIIANVGILSGGTICLFGFAVLTAIFKRTIAVTGALILNLVTLTITCWLISTGRLGQAFPFFKTPEAMMVAGTTFMLINTVVAISVRLLVKGLAKTNLKQKELVINLESEKIQIEKTRIMLELEVKEHKKAEKALKESEERYRDLVENATDMIVTHDLQGRLLSVNAAAEKASGLKLEENPGIRLTDLMPFDRRHEYDAYIEAVQLDGTAAGTMQFMALDEGVRFWEYRSSLRSEGIPVPTVRAIARDVTEKVEAKKKLAESEKRYRLLFQRNLAGVYRTTLEGRLLDCNEAYARIYGYGSREEALLQSVVDFYISPEARQKFIAALHIRGSLVGYESQGIREDDRLIWVSENASLVPDENGKLTEIEGTLVDITDRRRAEEALKESEARWKFALEGSKDGVWDWDVVTNTVYFSERWKTMLGYATHEVGNTVGEWERRIHPEDKKSAYADLERHFRRETETYQNEHRLLCKDGSYKWILDQGKVIEWTEDGKPRRVIGTHTDISERKRAEEEKAFLESQNRQLQKAESLGRMAGAISHHFNNQLAVVMGNLELAIIEHSGEGRPVRYLTEAMQSARNASKMSGLMLTYLGQTQGKREPLDLSDFIRHSLPMLRDAIPKDVVFNTDMPSPGPTISADVNQVQQVIVNLIANAWEAMDRLPGTINLTVKTVCLPYIPAAHSFPVDWKPQESSYACIEVADTGCGIAGKDIEKIFDPFFSSKFTGRGLGLAVVLGIMKSHEGAVDVSSEPGRGSIFRVFFPVSKQLSLLFRKLEKADETPVLEGGSTLLLVEDEDSVRKMARSMLTLMGHTVFDARDGIEAVEVFRQHRDEIRCVLCDLTMPRLDGWGTLIALRKLDPGIPVILASGYDREKVMAGDHAELPQEFLNKPYDFKSLGDAIRRAAAKRD